ncbi:hypothetical protein [Chondromyces apiculatus]|uniref:Uncharacterized protein n=1 Tax=Chondromyces apiculatus DSM 436 TaxID=1192034 RepID=A0A017TH12_9BACT|nr:hypothetical protein [Chondromyces apiculatus]EYF08100.1 Hypothetical protein CAP_5860 [Chondromyces apiculatus DSM 436]
MWVGTVITDFNGIVLFEPHRLETWYGGQIEEGTDLFSKFTQTDAGDEVLIAGQIVPVLAIDDSPYQIIVRLAGEPEVTRGEFIVENGIYPLRVERGLFVADLAVLKEWEEGLGWQPVDVLPGNYAVTIRGFRALDSTGKRIIEAGYEFILEPRDALPALTADVGKNMRVMW